MKREKKGTWKWDSCDHCHEYICDIPGLTEDCKTFPPNGATISNGEVTFGSHNCKKSEVCKNTEGMRKYNSEIANLAFIDNDKS